MATPNRSALKVKRSPSRRGKPSFSDRFLGVGFQIGGGLGSIISVLVIVALIIITYHTAPIAQRFLRFSSEELYKTADLLHSTSELLQLGAQTLGKTHQTLEEVMETLEKTRPLLTSTGELLGKETPKALEATRQALYAAQRGAEAIDSMLQLLTFIPFIDIPYSPEDPLGESLGLTAGGLADLPDKLTDVQEDIQDFAESLPTVLDQLAGLVDEVGGYVDQLVELSDEVEDRAFRLEEIAAFFATVAENAILWAWILTGFVILAVLVFLSSQIALYLAGRRVWREGWPQFTEQPPSDEEL
jgi:hypothetical protein